MNCGNQCLGPKRAKTTNDIYRFQHECCKCNMYLCCKPNAVQVRGSQARLPSQIIQYDLRLFKKLQNIETSHFNSEIKRTFANCWIQFISTNLFLTRQKKKKDYREHKIYYHIRDDRDYTCIIYNSSSIILRILGEWQGSPIDANSLFRCRND